MPGTKRTKYGVPAGAALATGALGVVFGDIGTCPLYAVQAVFSESAVRPVPIDQTAVYGVISLVFWTITTVVTISYVAIIMRADDDGEGGILSLVALLIQRHLPARTLRRLSLLGLIGAAMFFGDGMITPAISVLSATEGLTVAAPSLQSIVVPAAVVILLVLFAFQRFGTGFAGRMFGPVMVTWFAAIA